MDTINYTEQECDRCGHEDIEWCMSDGCSDEEEVEEPYLCVDCGEDFKWKSGISSAGCGVNSYHCGSCNRPKWEWFNKKKVEEVKPKKKKKFVVKK